MRVGRLALVAIAIWLSASGWAIDMYHTAPTDSRGNNILLAVVMFPFELILGGIGLVFIGSAVYGLWTAKPVVKVKKKNSRKRRKKLSNKVLPLQERIAQLERELEVGEHAQV